MDKMRNVTRRRFLTQACSLGVIAALPVRLAHAVSYSLYDNSVVIDGLGFIGGSENPLTDTGLANVRESGLTAFHTTLGLIGEMPPERAYSAIMQDVEYWNKTISEHPDVLSRVSSAKDILDAKEKGVTGMIYGLQDGVAFETDIDQLNTLYEEGIRVIQPTYNRSNKLGSGCMEPADQGLSENGVAAVQRINELHILLDLSHCGRKTTADAIETTTRPFSFTHTGCAAVEDHPRNRTDQEIRACSESGGVTGMYIMPYLAGGAQPTAADVLRHLDHAFNVGGEDHVGIGTDNKVSPTELTEEFKKEFAEHVRKRHEAGIGTPQDTETSYLFASDLNTSRKFETLADMLLDRGYTERQVEKILGSNFLRLYGEVWD